MSLQNYDNKRDFDKTPEPVSHTRAESNNQLRFVIHKHQAKHLHYDLRLQYRGVLKSWAVPKGPSLDPAHKRLAIGVEDHPYEYRNFEGVIPEGNYGAGIVLIWDEGQFTISGNKSKDENEKAFSQGYNEGLIRITFSGLKLKGTFHLIKNGEKIKDGWFLIKKGDKFASGKDILLKDRSVRSGLNLEQIRAYSHIYAPPGKRDQVKQLLRDAPRKLFSGPVRPMKAVLVDDIFDREGWLFEVKWDGYRAIAECIDKKVNLYSRNGKSFLSHYPSVVQELREIDFDAVFDGEIVVPDKKGRPDFGALQNYRKTGMGQPVYYIFDLLYYEGYDLTGFPLYVRKKILSYILLSSWKSLKLSRHIMNRGRALYKAAEKNMLEGVMAKDAASPYMAGVRSRQWQKIKIFKQQEMVVGGFTQPKGGRRHFGALVVGVYENGEFVYTGNVGGGFSDDELEEIRNRLDNLILPWSPFGKITFHAGDGITWVRPELVCVVRFSEWTQEGIMRQPVFLGFREDSSPQSVTREVPVSSKMRYSPQTDELKTVIGGHLLIVTNSKKIYFPDDNISKGDVIGYYRELSPWILPHLADRPQSLHRFPDGIKGKDFFHKDIRDAPSWIRTERVTEGDTRESIRYMICDNEASLVYMVNLGTIEINPWISRCVSPDHPDFSVIDLDPLDAPFSEVIMVAKEFHKVLEEIGAPNYVKTSGSRGIHIFIPLGGRYSYEQSRQFSLLLCHTVNRNLPATTSMDRSPSRRQGKVYLDYLQNIRGKTMASVYSLRPVDGATVSAPLHWDELDFSLDPKDFNIHNMKSRISKTGDLWRSLPEEKTDMVQCLNRLGTLIYGEG